MAAGWISSLIRGSSYGFIVEDGGREEIEFHWTAVAASELDRLEVGQRIEFEKRQDQRDENRIRAVNVRLIQEK